MDSMSVLSNSTDSSWPGILTERTNDSPAKGQLQKGVRGGRGREQ